MRVKDIMTPSVDTIAPDETVVHANERMWRKRIHHLVVMTGDQVVGVLSDTDLGGDQALELPNNQLVSSVMKPHVVVADPQMTVDRAVHIFQERHLHCLPVIEQGKLVGIVTATDIYNLAKRGVPHDRSAGPYPPLNNLQQL